MTHPVTRQAFTAWLAKQDDSAIVGYTNDPNCCPIATFATFAIRNHPSLAVAAAHYGCMNVVAKDDTVYYCDHPQWIQHVITAIDDLSPDPEEGRIVPVTAGQVKEILRRVP